MYGDIKQGEHEATYQLDQCIKNLVERCQYDTPQERSVCQTELLFHATKHFKVKKWVRSKKKLADITHKTLLQYAKEHEMMVKDFNQHKSNGGVATAATINEIKTFKFRKGNGYKTNGGLSKTCSRCDQSHLSGECPVWGKYCHKCGNKNHFSMCCRSRATEDFQGRDQHELTHRGSKALRESESKRRSRSRHRQHTSGDSEDRSTTWSAHSIELNSFQDHLELHGSHPKIHESQP